MNITYGGIELPAQFSHTQNWDEEGQYSDDRKILECIKVNLATQTVLALPAVTSSMVAIGLPPNASPGQIEQKLRTILNTPRLPLVVKDERGNVILSSPAGGTKNDVRGGPFPKVSVNYLSQGCYTIVFEVETYISPCTNGTPPDVLSNRWNTTVRHDKNLYATRDITGTLRVSQAKDQNPDLLRGLVLPVLPDGFVRDNFYFTVESSGEALQYGFTDQQVYLTPPVLRDGTQATDIKGSYSEGTNDGVTFFSDFRIRLEGAKDTDKSRLFQQAAIIALAFVGTNGQIPDGALEQAVFSTELETNVAEIAVRVNRFAMTSMSKDFGIDDSRLLVRPPGTEGGQAIDPGSYGSWLATTTHAALVGDICQGNVPAPDLITGSNTPAKRKKTGSKPSVYGTDKIDTSKPSFSPSQLKLGQQYHEYMIDVFYVENGEIFVLPVAVGSQSGGSQSQANPIIVQAAGAIWHKIVKWTAERVAANPELPRKITSDPNEVYIKGVVAPCAPQLNPDKRSRVIRVSGVYLYALMKPPSSMRSGALPYDSDRTPGELNNSDFIAGIISPLQ